MPAPALAPALVPAPTLTPAPTLAPTPAAAPAPIAAPAPAVQAQTSAPSLLEVPSTPATSPTTQAAPAPTRAPAPTTTTGQSQARPPALTPATPASVQPPALAPQRQAAPPPVASPGAAANCKPGALGVARTVEIDTTGGPGFGFEHFKQHDFLRDKEVVLTFDDGPWLNTTAAVVKALGEECVRATFFIIGKHATYYPEILRMVAAGGHSVGSHTWSHQDLSKKSVDEAKAEVEKAISAVKWALGDQYQEAPFFRFPALRHPPELVTYLGERNIAIFSTDMDSFDFKVRKPEQIIKNVMSKLQKHGKGIVLMHDFQSGTAHAVPQLLAELKAGGYKVVHMRPKFAITTLPQYDEELAKETKLPTVSQRPTSSVVKDVD
ncbi:MAG: polysaccharide deacetylase family protein [Xanthobacteraceae bacterium]|nr:polysaccharide deacetylase family protein [Xanthobacteraceae bacterium]